jgi:hypothetical protein
MEDDGRRDTVEAPETPAELLVVKNDRPAGYWDGVHKDYAAGVLSLHAIYEKHGLTQGRFNYAKKQYGWKRRYSSAVSRKTIINSLFRLIDGMTSNLEIQMSNNEGVVSDKEVGVLGQLVNMMGKLIDIEGSSSPKRTTRETKQMSSIREKLVERIAELKRN